MKESCSHEGHKMGEATAHLRKMNKEHGHPDHMRAHGTPDDRARPAAAGAKVEGKAKEPMKAIDRMGKMGRKGG